MAVPATATLMFNPGPHEFYPGDLVCDKDSGDQEEKSSTMSVVLSADERSRMAVVRRVCPIPRSDIVAAPLSTSTEADTSQEHTTPSEGDAEGGVAVDAAHAQEQRCSAAPEPEGEKITCSVFDLQAHPDFSFRMGDVVLRLDSGAGMGMSGPGNADVIHIGDDENDETGDEADDCDTMDAAHVAHGQETGTPVDGLGEGGASRGQFSMSDDAGVGHAGYIGDTHSCPTTSCLKVGMGAVGEVMDVESSGHVVVAWMGGIVSRVHPEEIYRVAIEEEVEDAMFYQEENAYAPNGQTPPSFSMTGSSASMSGGVASGVARVAAMPLLQASVSTFVIPTMNALSHVGTTVLSLPVLGKVIESSSYLVRVMLTQLFRLFVPMRLLPASMQTAGAGAGGMGIGVALSPSLLASSLGLGRFLGLSHSPSAAHKLSPAATADSSENGPEDTASDEQHVDVSTVNMKCICNSSMAVVP